MLVTVPSVVAGRLRAEIAASCRTIAHSSAGTGFRLTYVAIGFRVKAGEHFLPTLLPMTRVLFAVSGSDYWTLSDGTRHPCGYWPEELAVPHEVFAQAGFDITIATPGAVPPTADEAGFSAAMNGGSEEPGQRFRAYLDSISGPLGAPAALEDADPADYDMVFVRSRAPWLLEDRLSSAVS